MFDKLINCGTYNRKYSEASKIKILNIVSIITILVSALYTCAYFFVLEQPRVALINTFFTLAYCFPLLLNIFNLINKSKVSFFCILMLHLFVCTNIYVTNASGFHLYYFLVPTGAFLLFNANEKFEKISLSIIAVILFFYCENSLNLSPLIKLTDQVNHVIYQSVIFVNMIEVIVVMTIFSNQIEINETKLTKIATTDSLTGITNRHFFFELGNEQLALSHQHNRSFSLALIDFDNFKHINDTYGHLSGDTCLVETTNILKRLCREHDILARIGGDEFAITLPNTTKEEASNIVEKLCKTIENHAVFLTDNPNFTCTISIGVTSKTSKKDTFKSLLNEADHALYQSKERGRNQATLFNAS